MSREALDDRISYCRRELAQLEQTRTTCQTCGNRRYNKNECMKHGPVPVQFMAQEDCPDWEFELIPF